MQVRSVGSSSFNQLQLAIARLLPAGLHLLTDDKRLRWNDRMLVIMALLMGWLDAVALKDRFDEARSILIRMYGSRRRPGKTYRGFIRRLMLRSNPLLRRVAVRLRRFLLQARHSHLFTFGYIVLGADSTKIDCPMTDANEKAIGVASRKKSGPQFVLTTILHLATDIPWAFIRGRARSSERLHLKRMVHLLPPDALLLMDAGFTGYDLLTRLQRGGHAFILRVGRNVRLLQRLGYYVREYEGIVYLWPDDRRKRRQPPMTLRHVQALDPRGRTMHLLVSVLEDARLNDQQALELYRMRWGIELSYRTFKQTLNRRKLHSGSPRAAGVECDWNMMALWMMQCIAYDQSGQIRRSSVGVLRVIRQLMGGRRLNMKKSFQRSVMDRYLRIGPKTARHWPHKKNPKPPGDPKARIATASEIALAKELKLQQPAA